MTDLHIEEFYRDAAIILARLYAAFPRKTSVYVEDVAGADTPDEFGLHSTRHLACFGTMVWLAEEGWIRYIDTIGQLAIDQATLSQAIFVRLSGHDQRPPDSQQAPNPPPGQAPPIANPGPTPRIALIRGALESGSSTEISRTVKQTLFTSNR